MKQNFKNLLALLAYSLIFALGFGVASADGISSLTVSGTHNIDKLPYQNGETFSLIINASPLYAQSGSVKIVSDVNSTVVGSFIQQKAALQTLQTQNNITVNSGNGFNNGANTVTVTITDTANNNQLGKESATVNANLGTANNGIVNSNNQNTGAVNNNNNTGAVNNNSNNSATTPCSGQNPDPNKCIYNPLPENDLVHTFLILLQGFLAILGVFSVTFIVVGGFQMVVGSGNEEAYLKGKKTIVWAILGLVIALLSFSIIAIVEDLLQTTIKPAPSSTVSQVITITKKV